MLQESRKYMKNLVEDPFKSFHVMTERFVSKVFHVIGLKNIWRTAHDDLTHVSFTADLKNKMSFICVSNRPKLKDTKFEII